MDRRVSFVDVPNFNAINTLQYQLLFHWQRLTLIIILAPLSLERLVLQCYRMNNYIIDALYQHIQKIQRRSSGSNSDAIIAVADWLKFLF